MRVPSIFIVVILNLCPFLIADDGEYSFIFNEESKNVDSRIVGAVKEQIENVPYQTSIQIDGQHRCGGAIINQRAVITAAHCVFGLDKKDITVRVGSSYHSEGGQVLAVEAMIVPHPFDEKSKMPDIAILILKGAISYGASARQIRLPKREVELPEGTEFYTSGWGQVNEEQRRLPRRLRSAQVPKLNDILCKQNNAHMTNHMICAGQIDSSFNLNYGDIGGPLQTDGYLYGIVSSVMPHKPAAYYTRVDKHLKWINETLLLKIKTTLL